MVEANEQYWRKIPSVRTLIARSVPDDSTRLAMLKRGEADIVCNSAARWPKSCVGRQGSC